MQVKKLSLANEKLNNNILFAPMAGYTDYAVRHLQLQNGAGLVFTELVSAKGLFFGGVNNESLLYSKGDYDFTSAQIFGEDAYYMRKACESKYLENFKFVDINMGCPVPKVFKNGEGSALLKDINKAENIVKECVKSGKIITAKIRTGLKNGDDIATEFTKMLEQAGAKMVSIHGRVREAYYSGEPDYNAIYKAKKSVNIPVIANGGIFSKLDAENMIDKTGADGVMIARGGIEDPFLVCKLLNKEPTKTLKEFILEHLSLLPQFYPDKKGAIEFRKFVNKYLKGVYNVRELKLRLMQTESISQIVDIIQENL